RHTWKLVKQQAVATSRFDDNGEMALSQKTQTSGRLHGIILMPESTSREKASPARTGFVFRLQPN
ncbi:hypothetical protein, partial [Salmonella enterica]|uniref:hypothetical protein n=1 Tax=Salmonella enterica TaxID=28901 RepID=UPI00398C8240